MKKSLGCIALVPLLMVVMACGGLGQPGTAFSVIPKTATTTAGGTVKIVIIVANADVMSYSYTVQGGDSNGTVVPVFNDHSRAIYTAPMTIGTYWVHASFTQFGGEQHSSDVLITVK